MSNQEIEIPRLADKDAFEELVTAIWKNRKEFKKTQRYGRHGQNQSGIDILAQRLSGSWIGIQCKVRENSIKLEDVLDDIERAKKVDPPLAEFYVATTAKRDARFQDELRKLDATTPEFDIDVVFWDDISGILKTEGFLHVYRQFYPHFFGEKCRARLEPFVQLIALIEAKNKLFPTVEEFHSGVVVSKQRLDSVLNPLNTYDRVLLWGNSSAGKTVLAISAAMAYYREGMFPVYFDFNSDTQKAALLLSIDYLAEHARNDTVAIFDNCHQSRDLALYYHRLRAIQESRGYKSIFISRTGPNQGSYDSEFISFTDRFVGDYGKAIRVLPCEQDFIAITKLLSRRGKNIDKLECLNSTVCDRFGRDLYVFSHTVSNTADPVSLDTLDPTVFPGRNPIDDKYLRRFSNQPAILDAFVAVAAFSALGLNVNDDCFPRETPYHDVFEREISEGLVVRSNNGLLSMAHPSLGSMITKRHAEVKGIKTIDYVANLLVTARNLPRDLFAILDEQQYFNFGYILKALYREPLRPEALLRLGIILPSKFWDSISSDFSKDYNRLLRENIDVTIKSLPVADLTTTSNIVAQIVHRVPNMAVRALNQLVSNRDSVWAVVSQTSPHIVCSFLSQLLEIADSVEIPREVSQSVRDLVSHIVQRIGATEEGYFDLLTRSSISLGYVTSLIKFLKPGYPSIHDSIAEALFAPSYRGRLVARGLSRQLDQFAKFIEYSQNVIGVAREDYVAHLTTQENSSRLLIAIHLSSLNSLVYYLRFWQSCTCEKCTLYIVSLAGQLSQPSFRNVLVDKLFREEIQSSVAFLETVYKSRTNTADLLIRALSTSDFVRRAQEKSKGAPSNQIDASLDRLSLLGDAGTRLTGMLREALLGSRRKELTLSAPSSDIRETISYLKSLHNKREFSTEEELLQELSRNSFFENWLTSSLAVPWRRRPRKNYRIDSGLVARMSLVFRYMKDRSPTVISNLFRICINEKQALVNVLMCEHIDMVSLFLDTLRELGDQGKVLHQALVQALSQERAADALCSNSFKKDVSYLKSFLAYTKDNAPELHLRVLTNITGPRKDDLFDACASSTPHQLVSFLHYLDTHCSKSGMTSENIIDSFKGLRLVTFRNTFNKADPEKRGSLLGYLERKGIALGT